MTTTTTTTTMTSCSLLLLAPTRSGYNNMLVLLLIGAGSLLVIYFHLVGIYWMTAAGCVGKPIAFHSHQQQQNGRTLLHDGSSLLETSSSSSSFDLSTTPRFCIETSRCKTLHLWKGENHRNNFSFVHISRASGASWVRELKNVVVVGSSSSSSSSSSSFLLFPQYEQGAEFSVVYQNSLHDFDFLYYHLISLRSPLHHVWSIFTFCKYGEWGVETTKGTNFPRTGTTPEADLEDFRTWLHHFVRTDDNSSNNNSNNNNSTMAVPVKTHCYGCYQAANYQTRVLTSTAPKPGRKNDKNPMLVPDFELSRQVYESMDWVAMTEFFHESKCLLYYRLEPKTTQVIDYIQNTCHCQHQQQQQHHRDDNDNNNNNNASKETAASSMTDVHITHHAHGGRRSGTATLDLSADILALVDALTRIDQKLYQVALEQFMREMVWLETRLGRRVLCDHVLDQWEPELSYLNVSVTSMYNMEKRRDAAAAVVTTTTTIATTSK